MLDNQEETCAFCHESSLEICLNDRHGFLIICSECGYVDVARAEQLVAHR